MNVVLSDMESTPREFMDSLRETTGMKWEAIDWQSNQMRTGKASEAKRYLKYVFKPLSVVFRRDLENICAWQQFYGISYAFWSRLFHRPKTARLTVMTFIYKPKGGRAGRLYERFVRYAVTSDYIDTITCSSSDECDRYSREFGVPRDKFRFVPWCIEDYVPDYPFDPDAETGYILASGRSNRDYPFFIGALRGTGFKAKVVDDTLGRIDEPDNVEVIRNSAGGHSQAAFQLLGRGASHRRSGRFRRADRSAPGLGIREACRVHEGQGALGRLHHRRRGRAPYRQGPGAARCRVGASAGRPGALRAAGEERAPRVRAELHRGGSRPSCRRDLPLIA